jgi:hypothetical protein
MFGIEQAVDKLKNETIPALRQALLSAENVTLGDIHGILDRLDGAEIEIGIKLKIQIPNRKAEVK